eukprot:SAG11_NODE_4953_length_1711_cov_2.717742_1_plen_125_part_10
MATGATAGASGATGATWSRPTGPAGEDLDDDEIGEKESSLGTIGCSLPLISTKGDAVVPLVAPGVLESAISVDSASFLSSCPSSCSLSELSKLSPDTIHPDFSGHLGACSQFGSNDFLETSSICP